MMVQGGHMLRQSHGFHWRYNPSGSNEEVLPIRFKLSWYPRIRTPKSYRGTSLTRNAPPVGPYSSPMPKDLW